VRIFELPMMGRKAWPIPIANGVGRSPLDFARDRSGQALIEAALIFPILVGLFLGITEFSEAFTVNRRIEAAANVSADLVARTQSVTTADLVGIKSMTDEMIKPYATAKLGLIITSVTTDPDNTPSVQWSFASGADASPHAVGSSMTLPAGVTEPSSSIVVSEVQYEFQSTLARLIVGNIQMRARAYFRPRVSPNVSKLD
jgi:Flp pilus assembly protein TadG